MSSRSPAARRTRACAQLFALAHENKRKSGLTNVAFLKGEIEQQLAECSPSMVSATSLRAARRRWCRTVYPVRGVPPWSGAGAGAGGRASTRPFRWGRRVSARAEGRCQSQLRLWWSFGGGGFSFLPLKPPSTNPAASSRAWSGGSAAAIDQPSSRSAWHRTWRRWGPFLIHNIPWSSATRSNRVSTPSCWRIVITRLPPGHSSDGIRQGSRHRSLSRAPSWLEAWPSGLFNAGPLPTPWSESAIQLERSHSLRATRLGDTRLRFLQ